MEEDKRIRLGRNMKLLKKTLTKTLTVFFFSGLIIGLIVLICYTCNGNWIMDFQFGLTIYKLYGIRAGLIFLAFFTFMMFICGGMTAVILIYPIALFFQPVPRKPRPKKIWRLHRVQGENRMAFLDYRAEKMHSAEKTARDGRSG